MKRKKKKMFLNEDIRKLINQNQHNRVICQVSPTWWLDPSSLSPFSQELSEKSPYWELTFKMKHEKYLLL